MVEKRVNKFGRGLLPPLFGRCPKENIFFTGWLPLESEKVKEKGNKKSKSKVGTHIGSDNNWTTEISFITPCFVLHNSRANWGKRKSLGNYFLSKLLVFAFIEDLLFGTFLLRMRICLRIVFNGTLEHIVDIFIFHVQLCLTVKDVEKIKINQCMTN